MADGKNKVIVYTDWIHIFELLSDEEAGLLIKHFFKYINDQDPQTDNRIVNLMFEPIKQTLKRDLKQWIATQERNKINGQLGGRPKKTQNNPTKPSGFLNNPKKGDKDSDKDNDSVIVFNNKPFPVDCGELPEEKAISAKELIKITRYQDLSLKQIHSLWPVFLTQNINGEKWYNSINDVHSHFINWIKNQKFEDLKESAEPNPLVEKLKRDLKQRNDLRKNTTPLS